MSPVARFGRTIMRRRGFGVPANETGNFFHLVRVNARGERRSFVWRLAVTLAVAVVFLLPLVRAGDNVTFLAGFFTGTGLIAASRSLILWVALSAYMEHLAQPDGESR